MDSYESTLAIDLRKQEGIFYSPNFITNYIITETANEYLASQKNTFKALQNVKIIDLACGAGAFLIESFDFLLQKYQTLFPDFPQPEKWIIENNLYGVDLDINAVRICKELLFEKSGFICENIKQGNSLIDDPSIDERAFDWEKEFPKAKEGFDLIVGNPPWGAFLESKEWLKKKYPSSSFGEINSYKYFIDKGLGLLKNNGILSFILPDSYLEKEYFSDVRKLIVQNSSLIQNLRLGDNIFKEVNLPSAILTLKKKESKEKTFLFADISKQDLKDRITLLESKRKDIVFQIQQPDIEQSFIAKSCFFRKGKYIKLIDLYDQVMGVKVYQVGKGKPKQTSFELENNVFISDKKLDNNYLPYVSQGIYRYFYENKNEFINYGEWLAEPRELKYFTVPKIVVREVMNSYIYATLIKNEAVVKNIAGVVIQKDKNYSLEYLLALLCSKLFAYCIKQESPKSANQAFPSINSNLLKNLPIKELNLDEQKPYIEKVNRLLYLNQQFYQSQKDFLDLIASNFGKDKFTRKLEDWYKLDWNEFSKELDKSKIKPSLPKQKEWKTFFAEEKAKVMPLDDEIQRLEKEIDSLVYKLYDLTEEEIKMVENG
jgi:predicted RNA methylase